MKKVAVILSGCGHKDGSEITEAVCTLIALSENGAQYSCFAPDKDIVSTNHITDDPMPERRNILIESARIARGQIYPLKELISENFDALVFPGGFGAALHLSTWAKKGATGELLPEISRIILEFYNQEKPICAICIAPTLIALALGEKGISLTVGNDPETISEINKTGAQHEICPVNDFHSDRENKIITTPAYMYKAKPYEVFTGIRRALKETLEMA